MADGPIKKIRHYRPMLQQAEDKKREETKNAEKEQKDANTKHLDNLKKALDESSTLNRNLGLSFVAFLVYVMIMVFNTSDLMLLLDETPIRLPLIGIEVSMFPFYIITPILVFALHINMLININEHTKKMFEWKKIIKQDSRAELTLHPFLLNTLYLDSDTNALNKLIVGILVDGVAYLLPLLTLTMIQVRFSDYQSWPMTLTHFSLTVADFLIIFFYYLYRNTNKDYSVNMGWGKKMVHIVITISLALGWCLLFWDKNITITVLLITLIIAILIFRLKDNSFFGQNYAKGALLVSVLFYACINFGLVRLILLKEHNHYGIAYYQSRSAWIHFPNIEVTNKDLVKKAPSEHIMEDIRKNPNQEESLWVLYSEGYNFSGRSLKYANLQSCKLFNFVGDSANFTHANLQYAKICKSRMNNAFFQYADLSEAKLYLITATNTQFDSVSFYSSVFWCPDIQGSKFPNANFQSTKLTEGGITNSKLEGAKLENANFKSINLSETNFENATFKQTRISNANLKSTKFLNPNLNDITFTGTYAYNIEGVYEKKSIPGIYRDTRDSYPTFLETRLDDVCNELDFRAYSILQYDPNYQDYVAKMKARIQQSCPDKLSKFEDSVKKWEGKY